MVTTSFHQLADDDYELSHMTTNAPTNNCSHSNDGDKSKCSQSSGDYSDCPIIRAGQYLRPQPRVRRKKKVWRSAKRACNNYEVVVQGDDKKHFSCSMSGPKQLMKQAEAYLVPGWFSSADHMAAASLFEQAGKQFLLKSNNSESASNAYAKAAQSHMSPGGRGVEAASLAYEEAGKSNPREALAMFQAALELKIANGQPDRAIEGCARGADVLENSGNVEGAMHLSLRLVELVSSSSEVPKYSVIDAVLSTFKRLVKGRKVLEAIKLGETLLRFYSSLKMDVAVKKMAISLVVLQLVRGDVVKARHVLNQALQDDPVFARSSDADATDDFLCMYESMRLDEVKKLVTKPPFTNLEYAVTMIAQELNPTEKFKGAVPEQVQPNQDALQKASLFSSSSKPAAVTQMIARTAAPSEGPSMATTVPFTEDAAPVVEDADNGDFPDLS